MGSVIEAGLNGVCPFFCVNPFQGVKELCVVAVLHSPAYRERYKEFLKIDFPRVPYPKDAKSFRHLVGIGAALRRLHLMIDVAPKKGLADFPIEGASVVETPRYADQKVYVNANQYFGHVPPEAWEFYVGGYQPAQKWLKDRIGQTLCIDDIWHYQKIIFVLCETAKIMKKLQNIEDLACAEACEEELPPILENCPPSW